MDSLTGHMIDQGKYEILGVRVDAVDYAAAVNRIVAAAEQRRALGVTALAVHGLMTGVLDRQQRFRLNALDLVVPDGQPVRWALNLLHGTTLTEPVRGPELLPRVCGAAAARGLPVYFYGSTLPVLQRLADNLKLRFPGLRIAGIEPSQFRRLSAAEQQAAAARIAASGAAIAFVGLGCPRQEVWVYEHLARLDMPMAAVGYAFDVHAGQLPEAPRWMRARGLEWLFRLTQEPGRLWRRYVLLNPAYLALVALQKMGLRCIRAGNAEAPKEAMRYG